MAYVEYEADGKTIKARVQQKTDTLANWMANDNIVLAGEQAFVVNDDGTPLNFKIGDGTKPFRDLPNWIDFSNAQRVSSVAPGVLPAGPADETRYMEVTEIGTYTYGGNTLATITEDGYKATFWWTGTEWISNGVVRVKGDTPEGTDVLEDEEVPKGIAVKNYVNEKVNIYQNFTDTAMANTIQVDSVTITDVTEKKKWMSRLDNALKSIKVFGLSEGKYILVRQTGYTLPSGNFNIGFSIVDNPYDSFNLDTLKVWFKSQNVADITKPFVMEIAETSEKESFHITVDASAFASNTVEYNFRVSSLASFKTAGIKGTCLQLIQPKALWGINYYLVNAGAVKFPRTYYLNEAVKGIGFKSDEKKLLKLRSAQYNSTVEALQLVISYCDDDNNNDFNITSSRNGYGFLRMYIPVTDVGIKRYESFVFSGATTAKVTLLMDASVLVNNIPGYTDLNISVKSSDNLANWVVSPISGGGGGGTVDYLNLINGTSSEFAGNFKWVYPSGNWSIDANSQLTKLVTIPEGTNSININAELNGSTSNVMLLDKNMELLRWAYEGTSTITSLEITDLTDVKFMRISTTSTQDNVKVIAHGLFDTTPSIKEYRCIHEGLGDVNSGKVFKVNGFFYEKDIDGLCDLSEYKSVNDGWLDSIPTFEIDGSKIVPTNVLHTDGVNTFSGGTLCAIKDGVMYFYNMNALAVFKSEDKGNTFTTIVDKYSHPTIFTQPANEARTSLVVMDNGELLIPVIVSNTNEPFNLDPLRYNRYYQLYRTTDGQTDLEPCFRFSFESVMRWSWLEPTDPNYNSGNYTMGCMLGDFTHATKGNLVVITEYGQNTSKYWSERGQTNNGRGISGRAWCSFDYGVTWKKMFDGDRKKVGTDEADDNWYYFTSTNSAKLRHMHGVDIDEVRNTVQLTNGDGEDYIWSIAIDDLEDWYQNAEEVGAEDIPTYKTTDTYPNWTIDNLTPVSGKSNFAYSSMREQMMKSVAVSKGLLWAHDASREFAYLSYYNDGEFIFEPVKSFEKRSDFATQSEFVSSWGGTDGFVQDVKKYNGIVYMTHSNGGTRPSRIWATIDGVNWKVVFEGANTDIRFATKLLFDGNRYYLTEPLNGQASATTGYYKLRIK